MNKSRAWIRSKLRAMTQWYASPLGRWVLQAERDQLEALLGADDVHGQYFLQWGGPEEVQWLSTLPSSLRCCIHLAMTPYSRFRGPVVCGDWQQCAFRENSVEVILLPHTLELVDQPIDVLKRASRVLAPEGKLIILGFNPWSLCGMRARMGGQIFWPELSMSSVGWVRRALMEEDLRVVLDKTFLFRPMTISESWRKHLLLLEYLGAWGCWLFPGAIYMLVASKRYPRFDPLVAEQKWAFSDRF